MNLEHNNVVALERTATAPNALGPKEEIWIVTIDV